MKTMNLGLNALLLFGLAAAGCSGSPGAALPDVVPTAATPVISPSGGSYSGSQSVTVSCQTAGAVIRYTTDGSLPTDEYGIVYTGAFSVSSSQTVRAVASRDGYNNSTVASASYTIAGTVPNPVFSVSGGSYPSAVKVKILCSADGASIRYTTDGSDPNENAGMIYNGTEVTISNFGITNLKAVAYRSGSVTSSISSVSYTITGYVAAPVFSPTRSDGAEYVYSQPFEYTISCATAGAVIRYTTDGSVPTRNNGTIYSSAQMVSSSVYVRAIAYVPSWSHESDSSASQHYAVSGTVPVPECDVISGTVKDGCYPGGVTLSLSCSLAGAKIYYSLDGWNTDHVFSDAIVLSSSTDSPSVSYSLSYYAAMEGYTSSPITDTTYVVTSTVAKPEFSIVSGNYTDAQNLNLSCKTEGSEIFYSFDSSDPAHGSWVLYTGPVALTSSSATRIYAYAARTGWADSSVVSGSYTITGRIPSVIISPESVSADNPVTVTLSMQDALYSQKGAVIMYTVDGREPSRNYGIVYSKPFIAGASHSTMVKAMAYIRDWQLSSDSDISSSSYTIARTICCAGTIARGGVSSACVWKNGQSLVLDVSAGITASGTYATGICRYDDDLYVSGSYTDTAGVHHACAWKVGVDNSVTFIQLGLGSGKESDGTTALEPYNDTGGSQASGIYATASGVYATGYFTARVPAHYHKEEKTCGDSVVVYYPYADAWWYMKCACVWDMSGNGTLCSGFSVPTVPSPAIIPSTAQGVSSGYMISSNGRVYSSVSYAKDSSTATGKTLRYVFSGDRDINADGEYTSRILVESSALSETAYFFGYTDIGNKRVASVWSYGYLGTEDTITGKISWAQNVETEITLPVGAGTTSTPYYAVSAACLADGVYYAAGYRRLSSGSFRACRWSGAPSALSTSAPVDLTSPTGVSDSYARSVAVCGAYVYVAGCGTAGAASVPIVWINDAAAMLPDTDSDSFSIQGIVAY